MESLISIKNGTPVKNTFSKAEYDIRIQKLRTYMAAHNIYQVLFTSYHNIAYYSDFLYCHFGRFYGHVVGSDTATTISANIDGGQPWRRSVGDNLIYTDWHRDNYFKAVQKLIPDGGTIGIEFDHINLVNMDKPVSYTHLTLPTNREV